jgi:hypothetical protein
MTTRNPYLATIAVARSGQDQEAGLAIRIVAPPQPASRSTVPRSETASERRIETARPAQEPKGLPPMLAVMA